MCESVLGVDSYLYIPNEVTLIGDEVIEIPRDDSRPHIMHLKNWTGN
jgi:hypothetical protein